MFWVEWRKVKSLLDEEENLKFIIVLRLIWNFAPKRVKLDRKKLHKISSAGYTSAGYPTLTLKIMLFFTIQYFHLEISKKNFAFLAFAHLESLCNGAKNLFINFKFIVCDEVIASFYFPAFLYSKSSHKSDSKILKKFFWQQQLFYSMHFYLVTYNGGEVKFIIRCTLVVLSWAN